VEVETKFFYTNAVEVNLTPYDVNLKFQRRGTFTDQALDDNKGLRDVKGIVAEALVIGMSPTHAKAMVPGLVMMIQEYEKRFGKISVSPEEQTRWEALGTVPGSST